MTPRIDRMNLRGVLELRTLEMWVRLFLRLSQEKAEHFKRIQLAQQLLSPMAQWGHPKPDRFRRASLKHQPPQKTVTHPISANRLSENIVSKCDRTSANTNNSIQTLLLLACSKLSQANWLFNRQYQCYKFNSFDYNFFFNKMKERNAYLSHEQVVAL